MHCANSPAHVAYNSTFEEFGRFFKFFSDVFCKQPTNWIQLISKEYQENSMESSLIDESIGKDCTVDYFASAKILLGT